MSKNIPDIKKACLKHFLNTFGIKNGFPPADRTARPHFDDKMCSKKCFKNDCLMSGIVFSHFFIFFIRLLIKKFKKNTSNKSSIPITWDFREKNRIFKWMIIPWHLIGAITPTSILIFIAAFEFGLQKLIYIDLMQV